MEHLFAKIRIDDGFVDEASGEKPIRYIERQLGRLRTAGLFLENAVVSNKCADICDPPYRRYLKYLMNWAHLKDMELCPTEESPMSYSEWTKVNVLPPDFSGFVYNSYHFEAVGKIPGDSDIMEIMRSCLASDVELGFSAYKWKKHDYSNKEFYEASGNSDADIFRCLETGRLYIPGENELFLYTGQIEPYSDRKKNYKFEWRTGFIKDDESLKKCIQLTSECEHNSDYDVVATLHYAGSCGRVIMVLLHVPTKQGLDAAKKPRMTVHQVDSMDAFILARECDHTWGRDVSFTYDNAEEQMLQYAKDTDALLNCPFDEGSDFSGTPWD